MRISDWSSDVCSSDLISAQFPHIRGYTTFGNTAKINGRTFYRLALSGFDSRQDAQKTCSALRAKGSACFVRGIADHAAPRWVSREIGRASCRERVCQYV